MVNWQLAQTPDFLNAFNTGYDRGRTQAHDRGVQDALAQLDTNPQGAESALLRYGEVGTANSLRTQRQTQEADARSRDAYSMALRGDMAGARAAAASAGDFDLNEHLDKMDEQSRSRTQAALPALVNIIGEVRNRFTNADGTPDLAQRAAFAAHMVDQAVGLTPEAAAEIKRRIEAADWSDEGMTSMAAALNVTQPQERGTVGAGSTVGTWAGNVFTPQFTAPTAPQRPLVLGPNATALDPVTGQPIFRAPPAPARPSSGRGGGGGGGGATYSDLPPNSRVVR